MTEPVLYAPRKCWGYEVWQCPRCKIKRKVRIGTTEVLCPCVKLGQAAVRMNFIKAVYKERENK